MSFQYAIFLGTHLGNKVGTTLVVALITAYSAAIYTSDSGRTTVSITETFGLDVKTKYNLKMFEDIPLVNIARLRKQLASASAIARCMSKYIVRH